MIFKCMESMPRDLRHPYIPSTTVLGDKIPVEQGYPIEYKNYRRRNGASPRSAWPNESSSFFQVIHPGSANSSCMPVTCIHFSDRANAGRMPVQQHKL